MSRQARVGLLVLAGVVLFLVGLFTIANRSFLFSDIFIVRSRFSNVAGLQSGAPVQYQGVNVGRVESVSLPNEPGEQIVVTMAIKEGARPLVRENTQAQIKSDGLVGNQIVVLASAEVPGPLVEEGEFIRGVPPFDLFEITDRAIVSVQRFEQAAIAAEQIMLDVRNGEGTLGKIIYDPTLYNQFVEATAETQALMSTLGDNAEVLVALAGRATEGVNGILTKINEGDGTVARLLNDPSVFNTLLATADTLQGISTDLRAITSGAEHATNWAALGAFRFAELMEAAKHNWVFKRYFEEQGYVARAPFEMRERALAQSYADLEAQQRALYEWQQRLEAIVAELRAAGVEVGPGVDAVPAVVAPEVPETGDAGTDDAGTRAPEPGAPEVEAPEVEAPGVEAPGVGTPSGADAGGAEADGVDGAGSKQP